MKATEFDRQFEAGEDITASLDLSQARRPEQESKRVNIDFPASVLRRLDLKANQLGLTRQALVKYWIAEKLDLTR